MLDTPYAPSGPHAGNGVATSFPFAFKIWALADLRVVRITNASGLEEVLTAGIDYTVPASAIGATAGGSITLVGGPLSSAYSLRLESNLQPVQTARYGNQGAVAPESIEASLDKLTRLVQQLVAVTGTSGENVATLTDINDAIDAAGSIAAPPTRYTTATRPSPSAALAGAEIRVKDPGTPEQVQKCLETAAIGVYEWAVIYAGGVS